jgi:hypothetical protein
MTVRSFSRQMHAGVEDVGVGEDDLRGDEDFEGTPCRHGAHDRSLVGRTAPRHSPGPVELIQDQSSYLLQQSVSDVGR